MTRSLRWVLFALLLAAGALFAVAEPAWAAEEVDLTPHAISGMPMATTVDLELGGELNPAGPDQAAQEPLPIRVESTLQFASQLDADRSQSVRYYRSVEATTVVASRTRTPGLRDSRRLVVATCRDAAVKLSGAQGPLAREEFDVLHLAADPLTFDSLLPGRMIKVGDSWEPSIAAMQAFTGLDSVGVCEVSVVLAEANERFARCQMAGAVHGVVDGAAAEYDLDAVFLFDRKLTQITQLNVAFRQARQPGPATAGLDAVAKLRVKQQPTSDSPLTPAMLAQAASIETAAPMAIETRDEHFGFATVHDTLWYPVGTRGRERSMRRVTANGLVAHVNISQLAAKRIDTDTALAAFASDVRQALGKDAHGISAEQQWTNQHGFRVMSVTVAGNVNGTPVEWHAYQVAPPVENEQLHRLALTFTVEQDALAQLGELDREFVDRLQLIEAADLQAKRPATSK